MGVNKTCCKCGECKSISYFYRQKKGLYGRTGECKDCRKRRSKKWSNENHDKRIEYSRKYEKTRDRRSYNEKWRKLNPGYFKEYYKQNREIRLSCNRRFWINHPERFKLFNIYQNAKRTGKIKKSNQCQVCGTKESRIQGHHFDYSKPLEATWLCLECHKDIHRKKKFTKIS